MEERSSGSCLDGSHSDPEGSINAVPVRTKRRRSRQSLSELEQTLGLISSMPQVNNNVSMQILD